MGTANKRPMIRVGKRNLYASRVAFSLFKGELKKGLYVCHTCDNVSCVNPDHLWLGTPKQNKVDSVKKGRSVGKDNWFRTR